MSVISLKKKVVFKEVLIILSLIILWIILAIPLLLYHLPRHVGSQSNRTVLTVANNRTACSNPLHYGSDSSVCLEALEKISLSKYCPLDSNGLQVMQNKESEAIQLLKGLTFIGASSQCTREALPFLCLLLFGVCSDEVLIQPTARECRRLQDSVCHDEWKITKEYLGDILPDCNGFPVESSSCHKEILDKGQVNRSSSDEEIEELECSKDFFRMNNSGLCVPNCYSWSQNHNEVSITIDVLVITFSLVGFVTAVMLIAISFCRYKTMLHYPSVLIIYMNLDILILTFFIMVPYASGKQIFCSSMNLLESIINVTTFCIVSGMLTTYVVFQLSIWWLLHMAVLFCSIKYPFRAQLFTKGKAHILSVVIGLLLPIFPILVSVADFAVSVQRQSANSGMSSPWRVPRGYGFGLSGYPPIICTAVNKGVIYYSTIFPIGCVLGLGGSLLIISIWLLHQKGQDNKKHFEKAEKKLLLIFSYYLVLTIVSQITLTVRLIEIPKFITALQDYIFCERSGHNATSVCDRSDVEYHGNPLVTLLPFLAVEILPAMLLVFVVNIGEIKKFMSSRTKASRRGLTANSTNISLDL